MFHLQIYNLDPVKLCTTYIAQGKCTYRHRHTYVVKADIRENIRRNRHILFTLSHTFIRTTTTTTMSADNKIIWSIYDYGYSVHIYVAHFSFLFFSFLTPLNVYGKPLCLLTEPLSCRRHHHRHSRSRRRMSQPWYECAYNALNECFTLRYSQSTNTI